SRRIGDWVEVCVSNKGPVIAEEVRDTIFEAFQQADDPSLYAGSGAGLGLAICSKLVQLHGGSIRYEPGPDQFNRFIFTLRAAQAGAVRPAVLQARDMENRLYMQSETAAAE